MAKLVASFAVAGAVTWAWWRWYKVPATIETFSSTVVEAVDRDVYDGCLEDDQAQKRPRHRPKRFRRLTLTVKVVRELKARFGIIDKPMEADRMAIRRYAYDVMTQKMKDISASDVSRVAPIAAELYWAKTDTEIMASQIRHTSAVLWSNACYRRRWWGDPWSWVVQRLRALRD